MANSNVSFLQSASIIPFIKKMDIQFVATAMLPDREVYCYFDETDIHNYVQAPNKIRLNSRVDYRDLTTNRKRKPATVGSGNSADILLSTREENTRNTTVFVCNVSGVFVPGATMDSAGQTSSVIGEYIHVSGESWANGTSNTIILANDSYVMANNYWGTSGANTVFITGGKGVRQFGNIAGFNNVTRALSITGTFTTTTNNSTKYTIGAPTGGMIVDDYGFVSGVFNVPADNVQQFKTGERVLKISDSPRNIDDEAETTARDVFYSVGLQGTLSDIGDPIKPKTIITPPTRVLEGGGGNDGNRDPLAQTFFVPEKEHQNGIFVTSVDLFFSTVDANNIPVTIELRPVENGFPSSKKIYPNSRVALRPDQCNTSTLPRVSNSATATTFTFRSPVYLPPGEHAIVVKTKSRDYRLYISELGQTIIGSTNVVSEQPYLGSLFKSQNATTWSPFQMQDLMFRMRRAKFNHSGTVLFKNRFRQKLDDADAAVDLLFPRIKGSVLGNTTITYTHSIDAGSSFESLRPNRYWNPRTRRHITTAGDYQIEATLRTTDNAVSPIISLTNGSTIAIQKLINNGNISNVNISITDGGSGYGALANVALIFGDGAGNTNPAVGYAIANAAGSIDTVIITDGGTRFTNDMTVTPASGSATFNFVSEVDSRGGPCQAKYISRIVTLAEGFDGGDLRLFITANKPSGTQIKCYYKIRNNQDAESFDSKNYIEFEQVTPATKISADEKERIEYEFRPSLTSDDITYTTNDGITFTTFHQYAVKIVLLSNNTTKNPAVYDMRCIALPGTA